MNTKLVKGVVLVALGAASYGVLATFVKLAGKGGYTTAELTFSQGFVGMLVLFILNIFYSRTSGHRGLEMPTKKDKLKLIVGGVSLGLTSTFYIFR